MDGVEVTRRLREWSQIPIIIVSVREQEKDKIAALDAGADDYLTKPFGVGELLARLRVAIRRSAQTDNEPVFSSGNLVVDLNQREVRVNEKPISLTPTEYDLLRTLIKHVRQSLDPRPTAACGLGHRLRERNPHAAGQHQQSAPEDRTRPGAARLHRDGTGGGIQVEGLVK